MNDGAVSEQEMTSDARIIFGFWTYLMTDCVLFASLFAVFVVLRGPASPHPFDLASVLEETLILLTSSFSMGFSLLAARAGKRAVMLFFLAITFLLGISFVYLELSEFTRLIAAGDGPSAGGFFSAFFTLVGTHGLHVSAGLLWMLALGFFMLKRGLTEANCRKLAMLALFWHFLDIIWIFIFTIVYLAGVL